MPQALARLHQLEDMYTEQLDKVPKTFRDLAENMLLLGIPYIDSTTHVENDPKNMNILERGAFRIHINRVYSETNGDFVIQFYWIEDRDRTPPRRGPAARWGLPKYLKIKEKDLDNNIYELKSRDLLTHHPIFTDRNCSIPDDGIALHLVFVHVAALDYISTYEERVPLLMLHEKKKEKKKKEAEGTAVGAAGGDCPRCGDTVSELVEIFDGRSVCGDCAGEVKKTQHILGKVALNTKKGNAAVLNYNGLSANIIPRAQTFPLNFLLCNTPTFQHYDHWLRFIKKYKLKIPGGENIHDYIQRFHEITEGKVYSDLFYDPSSVDPSIVDIYHTNPPTLAEKKTGVVTLNCGNKRFINIMQDHKKTVEVSTAMLLQEAGGLTSMTNQVEGLAPEIDHATDQDGNMVWIRIAEDGYLPTLEDPANNHPVFFSQRLINHAGEKTNEAKKVDQQEESFMERNFIKKEGGTYYLRVHKVKSTLLEKYPKLQWLVEYWLVFISEKLNVATVGTQNDQPKNKKLAIVFKHTEWDITKSFVSILTHKHFPLTGEESSASGSQDSLVLCLTLEEPVLALTGYIPLLLCSAHMTAEASNENREAMNREFYHVVIPKLAKEAKRIFANEGVLVVGSDANVNNIVLTAAVQEYNAPGPTFVLTDAANDFYKDVVIGLAVNNVTTHTTIKNAKNRQSPSTEESHHYDNITIFMLVPTAESTGLENGSRFAYTIKVPVYVGKRLTLESSEESSESPKHDGGGKRARSVTHTHTDPRRVVPKGVQKSDHSPVACRVGEAELVIIPRKYYTQPKIDSLVTPQGLLSNYIAVKYAKAAFKLSLTAKQAILHLKSTINNIYFNCISEIEKVNEQVIKSADINTIIDSTNTRLTNLYNDHYGIKIAASDRLLLLPQVERDLAINKARQQEVVVDPPAVEEPDEMEEEVAFGGSINKIQLIKEQIKIIKDKYKNTKLDKYLIQIDNLKHKIILQTFTDKLLKIKEQIKNYKTEMKANPNKKDKYIKNIDKLVERFNVLKQEQDTLKQNIKLKPTKDPKPTKNPTKDPKSTKISKPTTPSKPTKNPTKNPKSTKTTLNTH